MFRSIGFVLLAAVAAAGISLRPMPRSAIEGEYLVQLHANATDEQHEAFASRFGGRVFKVGDGFRAFHAKLSDTDVRFVMQQDVVSAIDYNMVVQKRQTCNALQAEPVSWGQVRTTAISAAAAINQLFQYNASWGQGVDAYIVDTGIDCTHPEFAGRCLFGINIGGGVNGDVDGHGTHCAGTVGGTIYGITKSVQLIAVKVLNDNGGGTIAGIIRGLEWVAAERLRRGRPAVINLSLGGDHNAVFDAAVTSVVESGVHVSIASGNDNDNACSYSPVSPLAYMVASTEIGNVGGVQVDQRSYFSNYGACIDIFAPGSSIISALPGGRYAPYSGTSMAAPHVTAAIVAYLTTIPDATPPQAKTAIIRNAQATNIANRMAGSPDAMLYVPC